MARANPGIFSKTIGDLTVTAMLDGQFDGETAMVLGEPGTVEAILHKTGRAVPPRFSISCFLIEHADGSKTLFDGGAGHAFGTLAGRAPLALQALGVDPGEITTILCSHAHPDHVVGLIHEDGSARYPNADLIVSEAELAFWADGQDSANAVNQSLFDGARAGLAAYRDRTRHHKDGAEAMPGIEAVALPGHTPGHTGFILRSGSDALFIWADIIHQPGVQFAYPDFSIAFDVDPELAAKSRRVAFDRASTDKMLVAGIHHDFPLFGHVRRDGSAFAWDAALYSPMADGLVS